MKSILKRLLARKVLNGPFAGMRYHGVSSGSALMPKILGTYELELHPLLARLQPHLNHTVVVVGAAEGYYAVGLLRGKPHLKVVAFEESKEGQKALAGLAELNRVEDRLVVKGACDLANLQQTLRTEPVDLVLMDVEGYEDILLNPVAVPELIDAHVLVELHDFPEYKMADFLRNLFSSSHRIEHIPCRPRVPEDISPGIYRELAKSVPRLRRALLWERGEEAGWFYLTPRHS